MQLVEYFVECPTFGMFSIFLVIRLKICVFGRKTIEVK